SVRRLRSLGLMPQSDPEPAELPKPSAATPPLPPPSEPLPPPTQAVAGNQSKPPEASPPQQVVAGDQSKLPQAPQPDGLPTVPPSGGKETAKEWVPWAAEQWPRDKVGVDDYPKFLRKKSGDRWAKKTIQNVLSELEKNSSKK